MPHTTLLSRAFELVRRERALWLLGFLFTLFAGSGNGNNINWRGSGNDSPFAGLDFQALLPLLLLIGGCALLFTVAGIVIGNVAHAGLVIGSARADDNEAMTWRSLWQAGWGRVAARLFGMKVLLSLPLLLVALLLIGCVALLIGPLIQASGDTIEGVGGSVALIFALICCSLPILLVLAWGTTLVQSYATRALVLGGEGITQSIGSGWALLRRHLADSLIFSLLLGVLGMIFGLILSLLVGLPLAVVSLPLLIALGQGEASIISTLLIVLPLGLIAWLVSAAISAPLQAFFETAWTLAWRCLTEGRAAERPQPAGG